VDKKKVPRNFRLTEEALRLLSLLAHERGVHRTSVVEMAIRDYAKKNLEKPPSTY
jgi:hypothetical protein